MTKLFCRLLLLLWFICNCFSNLTASDDTSNYFEDQRNDRPIIGILAQERDDEEAISFIATPYVKQMEASGARVVPVLLQQSEDYYIRIINETNGLLIPGGHSNLTTSHFEEALETLFYYARAANDRNEYYPIIGVSQGLEVVTRLILQQWEKNPPPTTHLLASCAATDLSVNLNFVYEPKKSRLFRQAKPSIIETLKSQNVTPNYHHTCLTPGNLTSGSSGWSKHLRILTTSLDSNGLAFVSTLESKNASRPIYLFQWHFEKLIFEFKLIEKIQQNVKHTPEAVRVAQYIGNFLVDEARKNLNKFATQREEDVALIYNCNPVYTMSDAEGDQIVEREHSSQLYWFPSLTGCDGKEPVPIVVYHVVAIVGMSIVIFVLLGVFIANWLRDADGGGRDGERDDGYEEIDGETSNSTEP